MAPESPQLLYTILILPSLFGLALLGEGFNKLIHGHRAGALWIFFGLIFIGVVIFLVSFSQII